MKVTAWNNGRHSHTGAGYGIKLSVKDRDTYFNTEWASVIVLLPDGMKVE